MAAHWSILRSFRCPPRSSVCGGVCVLTHSVFCFVAVVIAARVPSLLFQTVFDQPFLDLHEAMGLFNGMANDIHGGCHTLLRSVHGH